jgi:Asp-tRNA(Asn)/Glu-tRNA(Gln) amidotransferase A subunit family amidase
MPDDELIRLPAVELASKIRARKVSPVDVVQAVIDRIERQIRKGAKKRGRSSFN